MQVETQIKEWRLQPNTQRERERERESGGPSTKRSKESEGSKVRGVEFIADLNWGNLGIKFIVQGQVWNEEA
jgi:hypothetical protein